MNKHRHTCQHCGITFYSKYQAAKFCCLEHANQFNARLRKGGVAITGGSLPPRACMKRIERIGELDDRHQKYLLAGDAAGLLLLADECRHLDQGDPKMQPMPQMAMILEQEAAEFLPRRKGAKNDNHRIARAVARRQRSVAARAGDL